MDKNSINKIVLEKAHNIALKFGLEDVRDENGGNEREKRDN